MAIEFSWVGRNGPLQADIPVDHFEPGVTPAAGWQAVVECRFRADPGDPWGAPTIIVKAPPEYSASYEPPGDGTVKAKIYAIQDGRTSRAWAEFEIDVVGGGLALPEPYVDETDDPYVDENGETYFDKD